MPCGTVGEATERPKGPGKPKGIGREKGSGRTGPAQTGFMVYTEGDEVIKLLNKKKKKNKDISAPGSPLATGILSDSPVTVKGLPEKDLAIQLPGETFVVTNSSTKTKAKLRPSSSERGKMTSGTTADCDFTRPKGYIIDKTEKERVKRRGIDSRNRKENRFEILFPSPPSPPPSQPAPVSRSCKSDTDDKERMRETEVISSKRKRDSI